MGCLGWSVGYSVLVAVRKSVDKELEVDAVVRVRLIR